LIICGHLGRPKGKWKKEFSFHPVAEKLARELHLPFVATDHRLAGGNTRRLVFYTGSLMDSLHRKQIQNIAESDVVFLENMRFYPEEEENKASFAKMVAVLAEAYVNDAFGVDHHASGSVTGVAEYLPSYCGLLLEKEIKSLDAVLKSVKHPFVVMTGGIKLSEKVGALKNLGKKADKILVGGGVANLIFKAKGFEIGISKIEESEEKTAWQITK